MRTPVIIGGTRSAIGGFGKSLSSLSAPEIAAQVIQALLTKLQIASSEIQEVIMGEVLTAGVGQAPARQALIYAGLPSSIPALTVNKVCGSGLKSITLAAQAIQSGSAQVVLAGGMESMSRGPYLLPDARKGARLGHSKCVDSVVHDGLWDCYKNFHMGSAGELCASQYRLTRIEQDQFAKESYKRAQTSIENGHFKKEIAPIRIKDRKSELIFEVDEEPQKVDFDKMSQLKPAFQDSGTITAANSSSLSDGAAVCLVTSQEWADQKGFKDYFIIEHMSQFAHQPEWFTTAPIGALKQIEKQSGIPLTQIDAIEINEAFAVVPLVAIKELHLSREKVNPRGGAIALGHPIGCSGTRIVVTLMSHLRETKGKRGIATLCIGGGEAMALQIQRKA